MARLSVVIATRNRSARLAACLEALLSLPDRPSVIVVDNGSTDGTPDLVQRRFPAVRLLRLSVNQGAVARNLGVRAAGTDVVAFADDDSAWAPGSLTRAVEHMRRWPRLGLIAARTLVGPSRRIDAMSQFMATAPLGVEGDLPGPSVLGFLACASIVRREAFLQSGGFDRVVFFMGEEARVAYDLARLGWGLAYCDDVIAFHQPTKPNVDRRFLAHRNRALTSWMRRPVPIAVGHTARLARTAMHEQQARRAVAQLAQRLPAALARRLPPDPSVERALARLELTERAHFRSR